MHQGLVRITVVVFQMAEDLVAHSLQTMIILKKYFTEFIRGK